MLKYKTRDISVHNHLKGNAGLLYTYSIKQEIVIKRKSFLFTWDRKIRKKISFEEMVELIKEARAISKIAEHMPEFSFNSREIIMSFVNGETPNINHERLFFSFEKYVHTLNNEGFIHGDLKLKNIIVSGSSFSVIDWDHIRKSNGPEDRRDKETLKSSISLLKKHQ